MPPSLRDQIMAFISRPVYQPLRPRGLAGELEVADEDYGEFRRVLAELREENRIDESGGRIVAGRAPRSLTGIFRGTRRGFGFVTPDTPTGHGDLHVPLGMTMHAQNGDRVRCRVDEAGRRGGRVSHIGRVIEILERGTTRIVGRLHADGARWRVDPDGTRLHEPVFVDDVGAKHCKSGDQVVVEIVQYAEPGKPARGVIVERLGAHGRPGVDLLSIIRQHNLPDEFTEAALDEARHAAQHFKVDDVLPQRLDLREELIITIDPKDARDFDDAISLRRLDETADSRAAKASSSRTATDSPVRTATGRERIELDSHSKRDKSAAKSPTARRGKKDPASFRKPANEVSTLSRSAAGADAVWELGVHIADVSHFVPVGGPLDENALERGTSVYFPRHVVPMLPEVLSNGVCSLQEGVPRLCKSAFIRYDAEGRPVAARFANTVICSTKRLTYEEASLVLEGRTGGFAPEVVSLLKEMETLARTIRARRLKDGMLVLDLPEVELELDDDGRVVDAHPADTSFSHTLIEMFMVEANEAVARRLTACGVPFVRRVHPDPDPEALQHLSQFLTSVGFRLSKHPDRFDLQSLLGSVRGKPAARMVNLTVLKSMAQAVYSPEDQGHFALASQCYGHFTSPIRRYPDLHIHRLLNGLIESEHWSPGGRAPAGRVSKPADAGRHRARVGSADATYEVEVRARGASQRPGATDSERGRATSGGGRAAIAGGRATAEGGRATVALDAYGECVELGQHCSRTERRAQDAERELKLVKVLELMSGKVGEAFEGLITGIAPFGLFVQHPRFLIEGMIEVLDLGEDRWQLDASRSSLTGPRTGQRFRLGDVLKVAIARVEVHTRRMLLVPAERGPARRSMPGGGDRHGAGRATTAPTAVSGDRPRRGEKRQSKHAFRGKRHK